MVFHALQRRAWIFHVYVEIKRLTEFRLHESFGQIVINQLKLNKFCSFENFKFYLIHWKLTIKKKFFENLTDR